MQSPFADHFGANYVPSDEEIERIQSDLAAHTAELSRLDEQIRELSQQRNKIQAFIDAHKALISYPRRLPRDIVEAIFLACLPTSRNAAMSAQEAPLLLCRICSAWRTIALSTPRLWASLHIPVDFVLAKPSRTPAVQQWMQRAAACPMSLSVLDAAWGGVVAESKYKAIGALTKTIATYSAGWHRVELTNVSSSMIQDLVETRSAPSDLESFKSTGDLFWHPELELLKGPSLRSVSLDTTVDLNLVMSFLTNQVAWHQLTHLTLEHTTSPDRFISLDNMILLLRRCSALVSFHVTPEASELSGALVNPPSSAVLRSLETFIIPAYRFMPSRSVKYVLDTLSMPQLRRLGVCLADAGDEPHGLSLACLGQRLSILEDITVYLNFIQSHSLLETLQSFPALVRLVILGHVWTGHFETTGTAQVLEVLTDTSVCPRLQELELEGSMIFSKTTLDAFLQARVQVESSLRLQRLSVAFHAPPNDPGIPLLSSTEIQCYLSQGLNISLVFPHPEPSPGAWTGISRDYI
ncbi:hypothetical protein R3P38DRAFT_3048545 [Favolaschia claudopus]|uniref:F-box domain-containing protein n=1 Tax=Favolaschia claudopus TaxID=2862362 RepID=A0AAW0A612_9AGAR